MEQKHYSTLQKKHKLPSFKELDADFDVSEVEKTDYILKYTIRKMAEKVEFQVKLLDGIMHPETSASSLVECTVFSEQEKKSIFELYKQLMFWERSAMLLELDYSEQKNAVFIKDFYKEWQSLKKNMSSIIEKLKNNWKKDTSKSETLTYFG